MHGILKNTTWLVGGEIISRGLRIILVIYAARMLGAEEWGIASYVLSWATLFTIGTDMGLGAILTRNLAQHNKKDMPYISAVVWIKLTLLIVSGILIIGILPRIETVSLSPLISIMLVGLVFFDSVRLIPSAINKARETMHYETIIAAITQGTILAIGIYMITFFPSAEGLTIAYAAGSAVGTMAALLTIKKYLPQFFQSFQIRMARELITEAWPVAIIGLLGSIMLNTDIIMIGWLGTTEDIGYYSAAQKIIFTLYVLGTLMASAAFPAFARAAHDTTLFKKLFTSMIKNAVLIGSAIALLGIAFAPLIITAAFGAQYVPAIAPFIILLITLPLSYTTTIITNALLAHNAQNKFIIYAVLGVALNIIGNFIFIPVWGISGAALATLITQLTTLSFIKYKMSSVTL